MCQIIIVRISYTSRFQFRLHTQIPWEAFIIMLHLDPALNQLFKLEEGQEKTAERAGSGMWKRGGRRFSGDSDALWRFWYTAHASPNFLKIITWSTFLKSRILTFLRSTDSEFQDTWQSLYWASNKKSVDMSFQGWDCWCPPSLQDKYSRPAMLLPAEQSSWRNGGGESPLDNGYRHVLLGPGCARQPHPIPRLFHRVTVQLQNDRFPSQRSWGP